MSYSSGAGASSSSKMNLNAVFAESQRSEFESSIAQQSSIYTPEASHSAAHIKRAFKGKGHQTVIRKGGGETWEDPSLLEWDPAHFRLFVGDLGNDVNDDVLTKAFERWNSFIKAKVIRDKATMKTRGYGFVAFSDPEDFLKAWKEMNGKYVGSRPVKITKATTKVGAVEIGDKKAKELEKRLKTQAKKGVGKMGGVSEDSRGHMVYVRR